MPYEVVVVGGGIGGLTTAALLAARGVHVCLFEKESRAGGCAASFEKLGYDFEIGVGLYTGFGPGGIFERVFAELPTPAPETKRLSPAYVVRLPDQTEIVVSEERDAFEASLRTAFPECADAAIDFYLQLSSGDATTHQPPSQHLSQTFLRFRRFIDAQLQTFAGCVVGSCPPSRAVQALTAPQRGLHAIRGGASSLADTLVEAIKKSGGQVRLNTTVLRLAYDASGRAIGVDLLSGERVEATRAIVSNLTVWDTYGKLVGLTRTPNDIRSHLKNLHGWGAYLLFLGMEEGAGGRLPADHILALWDWQEGQAYDPVEAQLMFSAAPAEDARAPAGSRAVTVQTFTEASEWFAFHEDESEHEEQDQMMLEVCWERLHRALPELGAGVEVIETLTPRDFYELTRRKLGMVWGVGQTLPAQDLLTHHTPLQNLFMVGDTVSQGPGLAAVTQSALEVANEIAPPSRI